jgi:hypothetical protein
LEAVPVSPLRQTFERDKESRAGNHRCIGSTDNGLALGPQSCDSECHRNPVIAKRIYFRSVQSLSARNFQSVVMFLGLGSHSSQIGHNRGNPVRLLYP